MPELLQYFGGAFTVSRRVEKICDTVCPVGSRRMRDVVFLDGLRCDGTGHGFCQAACRIYFRESWLTRLAPGAAPLPADPGALEALASVARSHTHQPGDGERFRCQATEARRASTPLATWDPRQYVREVKAGNIGLGRMLWLLALRVLPWELRQLARRPAGALPRLRGAPRSRPPALGLLPGEWVEVRSPAEIAATLDARSTHRGLYFSAPEMATECGRRYRVRRRVERIIEESTGRMLHFKNDCIELEGPVCTGERSFGRWFCAREIYPYWREAWLKRVAEPAARPGAPQAAARAPVAERASAE
jgi:hypothetical protein